jgi:hypothetical protein
MVLPVAGAKWSDGRRRWGWETSAMGSVLLWAKLPVDGAKAHQLIMLEARRLRPDVPDRLRDGNKTQTPRNVGNQLFCQAFTFPVVCALTFSLSLHGDVTDVTIKGAKHTITPTSTTNVIGFHCKFTI